MRYTVVRIHPETGAATAVLAGKPRPKWAKELISDDDLVAGTVSDSDADEDEVDEPKKTKGGKEDKSKEKSGDESAERLTADYGKATNKALEAEIEARNKDRDDASKIVPEGTTKAELVAALARDDAPAGS